MPERVLTVTPLIGRESRARLPLASESHGGLPSPLPGAWSEQSLPWCSAVGWGELEAGSSSRARQNFGCPPDSQGCSHRQVRVRYGSSGQSRSR